MTGDVVIISPQEMPASQKVAPISKAVSGAQVFTKELSGSKQKAPSGASVDFCGVNTPTTAGSGYHHSVTGLGRDVLTL